MSDPESCGASTHYLSLPAVGLLPWNQCVLHVYPARVRKVQGSAAETHGYSSQERHAQRHRCVVVVATHSSTHEDRKRRTPASVLGTLIVRCIDSCLGVSCC